MELSFKSIYQLVIMFRIISELLLLLLLIFKFQNFDRLSFVIKMVFFETIWNIFYVRELTTTLQVIFRVSVLEVGTRFFFFFFILFQIPTRKFGT